MRARSGNDPAEAFEEHVGEDRPDGGLDCQDSAHAAPFRALHQRQRTWSGVVEPQEAVPPAGDEAMCILLERYARRELTREEFRQLRADVADSFK